MKNWRQSLKASFTYPWDEIVGVKFGYTLLSELFSNALITVFVLFACTIELIYWRTQTRVRDWSIAQQQTIATIGKVLPIVEHRIIGGEHFRQLCMALIGGEKADFSGWSTGMSLQVHAKGYGKGCRPEFHLIQVYIGPSNKNTKNCIKICRLGNAKCKIFEKLIDKATRFLWKVAHFALTKR